MATKPTEELNWIVGKKKKRLTQQIRKEAQRKKNRWTNKKQIGIDTPKFNYFHLYTKS